MNTEPLSSEIYGNDVLGVLGILRPCDWDSGGPSEFLRLSDVFMYFTVFED